jgi:phosphohistidine phosphatase SixA
VAELILMRHAQALPAALGATDFERPLSAPGRAAAAQAARRLAAAGVRVERVLYSPARRTRETAMILARELELDSAALEPVPELYSASPPVIREVIGRHRGAAANVMVVGHNPGISDFGRELGRSREQLATAAFWRLPLELGAGAD